MEISSKEFEAVIRLNPFDRYKYMLKKVVDFEILYSLEDVNKNLAVGKIENKSVLLFWPAKEYARDCKIGAWKDYDVRAIELNFFMDNYPPKINNEGFLLNMFPVTGKSGIVLEIEEFIRDIKIESVKYE